MISHSNSLDSDYNNESVNGSISKSDLVIVLCGTDTKNAKNVSGELSIAKDNNVPYILLNGIKNYEFSVPENVHQNDCVYRWSPDNIHLLFYKLFLV